MPPLCRWLRIVLLLSLLLGAGFTQIHVASAQEPLASGALDGMVFIGEMGQSGDEPYSDRLSFADGMFWSEICIRCGFKPGKYWTRTEPDGVHFRGELEGKFGIFTYEGRIIDGEAIVEVIWKMERWYWTSSRTLTFQGSTIPGETPYLSSKANQIAIDALKSELPDFCW